MHEVLEEIKGKRTNRAEWKKGKALVYRRLVVVRSGATPRDDLGALQLVFKFS